MQKQKQNQWPSDISGQKLPSPVPTHLERIGVINFLKQENISWNFLIYFTGLLKLNNMWSQLPWKWTKLLFFSLASQEAQEVMYVSQWVSEWVSDRSPTWLMWLWWVMIPLEDFTDVTLGCEKKLPGEKR